MGVSLGGNGGGSRRRIRAKTPIAQINVTPFVDVMLVLLIVFMISAPLITVGVPVELPRTDAAQLQEPDQEPLVVTVDAEGTVYLQEETVARDQLVPTLVNVTDANPQARIYVRGDRSIAYGEVMAVMGQISEAGFQRVSLIAEPPERS